jgi:hypothetical protein
MSKVCYVTKSNGTYAAASLLVISFALWLAKSLHSAARQLRLKSTHAIYI